jgi:hypothetical protein
VEGRFQRDHGPGTLRRVEHETAGAIRNQISLPQALCGLWRSLVGVGGHPVRGAIGKISLAIEPAGIAQRGPCAVA